MDLMMSIVFNTRWQYNGAFKSVNLYRLNEEVTLRRSFVTYSLRMWDRCF